MEKKELYKTVEGILFTMGDAVEPTRIAQALQIPLSQVTDCLEQMKRDYEFQDRGMRIISLESAYQMCTSTDIYESLIKIARQPKKQVLTDVMLETLSIVAYKQPVTKAEVDKIRGVSSDHAISRLVEYALIEELGRLDAPGRPMLFGTTEQFLRSFGVSSLDELPAMSPLQVEEFRQEASEEAAEMEVDI